MTLDVSKDVSSPQSDLIVYSIFCWTFWLLSNVVVKISKLINMDQAYADDLAITTRNASNNQKVLDRAESWLDWTGMMKAKPKKCVSLAYRQFKRETSSSKGFVPINDNIYAPYDPLLRIHGQVYP